MKQFVTLLESVYVSLTGHEFNFDDIDPEDDDIVLVNHDMSNHPGNQ